VRIRALEGLDLGTPRAEVIRWFGVSTATLTRRRRRQPILQAARAGRYHWVVPEVPRGWSST